GHQPLFIRQKPHQRIELDMGVLGKRHGHPEKGDPNEQISADFLGPGLGVAEKEAQDDLNEGEDDDGGHQNRPHDKEQPHEAAVLIVHDWLHYCAASRSSNSADPSPRARTSSISGVMASRHSCGSAGSATVTPASANRS